jgi:WD40 repeat protein/serine/threonine protein kinase
MTANSNQTSKSLAVFLSETPTMSLEEKLSLVGHLVEAVAEIHATSRIHRAISAEAVCIGPGKRCKLPTIEATVLLGGEGALGELIPPDLRRLVPLRLPPGITEVDLLLQKAGAPFDPRRIDLFQLGALLCRVVAGIPIDDYLRSPRAKGKIPSGVQRVIDSALGLDPSRRFSQASDFARELSLIAQSGGVEIPGAETPAPSASAFSETPMSSSGWEPGITQAAVESPLPFTRLGHYRIESRIGHGGMGDVYKGLDESLQRVVAIKVLPPELARNAELIKRFYSEASAIAKLVHPNIIQIYFIGEDAGHHFFAMQYVEGESLAELLHRKQRLTVDETLAICEQCLQGLASAHAQGLVHRDIKPGNILLDRKRRRALLADFGLAKALDAGNQVTATGMIMGTLDYISPEQGRGLSVDGRADLYSFGVLMYQALSGRVPFEADTATAMLFKHAYDPPTPLRQVAPGVPVPLATIVERLLAKSPDARYPSADALLEDLHSFRDGRPLAHGVAPVKPQPDVSRRTVMFRSVDLPEPPEVSAELFSTVDNRGWWGGLRDRYQSLFRKHAPEFLKQLQSTQQQIEGAISAYERRVNQLESDVQQGEGLLVALNQQAHHCDTAALTADQGSATETATRERQSAEELRRNAAEQESQLGLMRVNLAQTRARLLSLRGQRDVLNARLKAALVGARLHGGSSSAASSRNKVVRAAALGVLGIVVCILTALIVWKPEYWSKRQASTAASRPNQQVPPTTAGSTNPSASQCAVVSLENPAACVAFGPRMSNGTRIIAVGNQNGSMGFYHVQPGLAMAKDQFHTIEVTTGEVAKIVFSHDGSKMAAIGNNSSSITIWHTTNCEVYRKLEGAAKPISTLAFSTDDTELLSGGIDGIRRWDLQSGRQTGTLETGIWRKWVGAVAWSRDGSSLVVGARTNGAQSMALWNLTARTERVEYDTSRAPVETLAYSFDEKQIVGLAKLQRRFQVWDVDNAAPVRHFGQDISLADFTTDRTRAVSDGPADKLILWDVINGQPIQEFSGHTGAVSGVAIAPDDTLAASIGNDRTLRLWQLPLPPEVEWIDSQFAGAVESVAISPDGKDLYVAAHGRVAVHGLERHDHFSGGHAGTQWSCVAVTQNGARWLAAMGQTNSVDNVIEIHEGNDVIRKLRGHQDRITSAVFSKDGRQVLSGSKDGTIRVWDVQTEQKIAELNPGIAVNSVAFAPGNPRRCLSGGDENVARLWDLETKQEIRQFVGHEFVIQSVAFSSDGTKAITASGDRTIRIWDVESGDQLQVLAGHTDRVNAVAVSVLGDFILSGSDDRTVRRWSMKTGQLLDTFTGHASGVRTVAVSPNGTRGVSGGDDATVRVWKLSNTAQPSKGRLSPTDPVDLLQQIDLTDRSTKGKWKHDGSALLSPLEDQSTVNIANYIPAEYQLTFTAERVSGDGPLAINLVNTGSAYLLTLDDNFSQVTTLDHRQSPNSQYRVAWNGIILPQGQPHSVVCTVRKPGINVQVDGRVILEWLFPPTSLSYARNEDAEVLKALTAMGTSKGQFRFSEMSLIPLSPELKPGMDYVDPELRSLVIARDELSSPVIRQKGVSDALQKAGSLVSQIRTSKKGDEFHWQRVKLNEKGIHFGAIRFKSQLSVPANLNWAYAVPSAPLRWQIIPAKGEMRAFQSFHLERSIELPELDLPIGNSVVLQNLPTEMDPAGGPSPLIQPGQEYFVWFRLADSKPVDLHCAIQLVPVEEIPAPLDGFQIAQELGLTVPLRRLNQPERELRREFGSHPLALLLDISPDGKWVLLSDNLTKRPSASGYRARLLDCRTGALVRTFEGHQNRMSCGTFSGDSQRILLRDDGGVCRLWNVVTGERLLELPRTHDAHTWLFIPDTDRAVSVGMTIGVWDLKSGERQLNFATPAAVGGRTVAVTKDGSHVILGTDDGIVRFVDLKTGMESHQIPTGEKLTCMSLSRDGRFLATGSNDSPRVRVWNVPNRQLAHEFRAQERGVESLDLSANGARLLTNVTIPNDFLTIPGAEQFTFLTVPDHSIRLWDVATGKELLRIDDVPSYTSRVLFGSSADEAVSAGYDQSVRVWSLKVPVRSEAISNTVPEQKLEGHQAAINVVAFTADGRHVLSGAGEGGSTSDNSVRIWDVEQHRELRRFKRHTSEVTALSLARDGKHVLTAGRNGQTLIWNLESLETTSGSTQRSAQYVKVTGGTEYLAGNDNALELRVIDKKDRVWSMNNDAGPITNLDIDEQGKIALSSHAERGNIYVWDVGSGKPRRLLVSHSSPVHCLALAPYGASAVSGERDGTLHHWDVVNGRHLAYFQGHQGAVLSVALSSDSRRALSGGEDGTVRLWDLKAGTQIWQGAGHTGAVRSVAFSSDGKRAASGGADHHVCLWRLPDGPPPNEPVARDRKTAAALLERGVALDIEVDGMTYRWTDKKLVLPSQPLRLTGIHFSKLSTVQDADLAMIATLDHVHELNLEDTRITDAGLVHVSAMKGLQSLNLAGSGVTGNGLARLMQLSKLQTLNLGRLTLGETGLTGLQSHASLQDLTVDKATLSTDVSSVLQSLGRLQRLQIEGGFAAANAKLQELRAALPYCQIR